MKSSSLNDGLNNLVPVKVYLVLTRNLLHLVHLNAFFFLLQHNIKKLRSNIYKSHENVSAKRILARGSPPKFIVWKHWTDAFQWDQQHSLPLHHRLRPDHFDLTSSSLMRNHLAEQVLNKDMLNLLKVCSTSTNCIFLTVFLSKE